MHIHFDEEYLLNTLMKPTMFKIKLAEFDELYLQLQTNKFFAKFLWNSFARMFEEFILIFTMSTFQFPS